jgi:hypothetical protein
MVSRSGKLTGPARKLLTQVHTATVTDAIKRKATSNRRAYRISDLLFRIARFSIKAAAIAMKMIIPVNDRRKNRNAVRKQALRMRSNLSDREWESHLKRVR